MERTIRISTSSTDDVIARFEVKGEIRDWLRFEPENRTFLISANKPYELKIIIEPPDDARSDSYSGQISFMTEKYGEVRGRAGGIVQAGVTILLDVIVADEEIRICRAGGFDFLDIEEGYPLEMYFTVFNDGNVRIEPLISFDIWDQKQENIVMSDDFTAQEVFPTTEKKNYEKFSQ
ncbi:MAG: hypothetical protein ABIC04_04890 [Nanoarchaeota archaeon]